MVCSGTRDTDVAGWYEYPTTVGILFTALGGQRGPADDSIPLAEKTILMLRELLEYNDLKKVLISFHFFPEKMDGNKPFLPGRRSALPGSGKVGRIQCRLPPYKKGHGYFAGADGLAPFFPYSSCLIPVLIKLTSRGPVLFKQYRVGRFGKKFLFLKFRTMFINNDPEIHRNYVKNLIDQQEKSARGVEETRFQNRQ